MQKPGLATDPWTGVADRRYIAVQRPRPILSAVFAAEVGDVHRLATAPQLGCWAGLTPKHHESETRVRRSHVASATVLFKRTTRQALRRPKLISLA